VRKYTPKYTRSGTGRFGKFTVFLSSFVYRLKNIFKLRGTRPQIAVVARQRKWQIGDFSRKGGMVALCCIAVGVCGFYFRQVMTQSDIFRLSTLSVQGNRLVKKVQILDMGGIEQGINLLAFDTARSEAAIRKHAWIESAEIERSWPSALTIKVHEYRPLAMINIESETNQGLYYVDGQGRVFAKVEKEHELDFPVITGVESLDKVSGTVIAQTGLAAEAFQVIRLAAKGNPIVPLQTISEVNVSPGKGIIVYLVDRPFPIYMGFDGMRTKYNKLVKLLDRLYRKKKIEEIKEIRMDYFENRILVAKVES
jgi:cell division septal protein FtsQ